MEEWERRPFHKKTNKKTIQTKNFKSQKSRSEDLKTIMHRGSQPATYNKQQSCSAVQCSPSIVRTFSANPVLSRKNANPAFLFRLFLFIFSLACFPSLFLSLPTSRTSVCDLLLCSICTCTLCFCFGGGRVKLGTGGDAWTDGSMAQQWQGEEVGKITESSVLCFLPFTYFFYFSSQVYILFMGGFFFFFLRSF